MKKTDTMPPEFFKSNRSRLRDINSDALIIVAGNGLIQSSVDAAYPFRQDSNFWYLTGLNEPNLILVMDKETEYIIAPSIDPIRSTFDGYIDYPALSKNSGVNALLDETEGWEKLTVRIKKIKKASTILPAPAFIESLGMYTSPARATLVGKLKAINPKLEIIDLRSHIASLRMVKQQPELDMMQRAISQTADMFQLIENERRKAKYEYELMATIEKWRAMHQASYAYDPIIASGKNAMILHYQDNNSPLDAKNFLLLDIGARYGGYCADVTRTVALKPTERQQEVYEAVLAVHQYACSLLRPGTNLKEYELAVMGFMGQKLIELGLIKNITNENVREYYPHATSHFVGIDTHDAGDHSSLLASGMVMTVEPGIYITSENIAIRLEDMILITEKGSLNMTDHIPKVVDRL